MSLTFKDYKINSFAFYQSFNTKSKTSDNSKFGAFDRLNLLLDQSKNEEIHHKASTSFDWFSIPVWLIEINIRSIERNSRSIETMKNFNIKFLLDSNGSQFLFDQSKSTFNRSKGILDRLNLAKMNFYQNFSGSHSWHLHCSTIKNTFWFYQQRFTNQTLRFSRSLSRT